MSRVTQEEMAAFHQNSLDKEHFSRDGGLLGWSPFIKLLSLYIPVNRQSHSRYQAEKCMMGPDLTSYCPLDPSREKLFMKPGGKRSLHRMGKFSKTQRRKGRLYLRVRRARREITKAQPRALSEKQTEARTSQKER